MCTRTPWLNRACGGSPVGAAVLHQDAEDPEGGGILPPPSLALLGRNPLRWQKACQREMWRLWPSEVSSGIVGEAQDRVLVGVLPEEGRAGVSAGMRREEPRQQGSAAAPGACSGQVERGR